MFTTSGPVNTSDDDIITVSNCIVTTEVSINNIGVQPSAIIDEDVTYQPNTSEGHRNPHPSMNAVLNTARELSPDERTLELLELASVGTHPTTAGGNPPGQVIPDHSITSLDIEAQALHSVSRSLERASNAVNTIYAKHSGVFRVIGALVVFAGVAATFWGTVRTSSASSGVSDFANGNKTAV